MRSGRGRPVLYPDHWRSRPAARRPEPARIAVLLHVHFPELVDEVLQELKHIPVAFDLIVTNSSGSELAIEPDLGLMQHHRVLPSTTMGETSGRRSRPRTAACSTRTT